jgi:hypothetical protein
MSRDFCFRFFHDSSSPENNTRVILNFLKICRDIRKSRCTTGINDTGGKYATGATTLAANFASGTAGVVDNGGKFATVKDTSGKLPSVSATPVANLLVANNGNNVRLLTP